MNPDLRLADWIAGILGPDSDAMRELKEVIEHEPGRITRAFSDILAGYSIDPPSVIKVTRMLAPGESVGIVNVEGIDFISMCPHHFLPYFGVARVTYEPGAMIVGIGKLPRLVFALSRRLHVQEDLTRAIATTLHEVASARFVTVEMRARHLCMCYRGPLATSAETTTSFTIK